MKEKGKNKNTDGMKENIGKIKKGENEKQGLNEMKLMEKKENKEEVEKNNGEIESTEETKRK